MTQLRETPAPGLAGETVRGSIEHAARTLADAGVPTPRADAELLAGHVLGLSRGGVQAKALIGALFTDEQSMDFRALVRRRADREPLQHLTGRAAFRRIELAVGPGVFVPRPETELLVGLALPELAGRSSPRVVDLGTGSGAVALAVADEAPNAEVVGVEVETHAYVWARENAAALGLANVRMAFIDLAVALPEWDGSVAVVLSNPPYIPNGFVPRDPEVRRYDPPTALYGGADGLDPMRAVVATAKRLLQPGGLLAVEHAEQQGASVRALFDPADWVDVQTHRDLTDRDRATTARRP